VSERLLKSTATVGGMTLISRVLGFVRDVVIAHAFGAGLGADAFFVAFRIPNFFRRLFAEGAFSQAFVPILSEYRTHRTPEQVRTFVGHVSGTLGAVLTVVTVAGIIASPLIIMAFAPGYIGQGDKYALSVDLLRLTFPYLFFISLTALAGGILNTYGRFGVPAFTPVMLNISMIAATLWLAPHMRQPVMALAWGVFAAGIIQLLFQLPYLARLGMLTWPRISRRDEGVRRIIRLMTPALFGTSVVQINLLFDTLIASFLVTGSISWLYYSDRLVEFPLGVFGAALATVILPTLSRNHAQGSVETYTGNLDWGLRWVLIVSAPAMVGLLILAGPLLATLFQYGEFNPRDVAMAARSLMAFAVGLPAYIYIKVLASAFYARQDTRTPVRVGVIAMLANMGLNIALVFPLAHAGLALATALSAYLNAGLLYLHLVRKTGFRPRPGWSALVTKIATANALMAATLLVGGTDLAQWLHWHLTVRVMHLSLWVIAGAAVYLLALWIMGIQLFRMHPAGRE
jgi:putative peptidoglycan lipid II flippase